MVPLFSFEDVTLEVEVESAGAEGRSRVAVLDHVTVDLPDHSLVVIVGASGSGKSTLLRCCNRLEVPTSGQVRFRGTPLDEMDVLALRRRVGMVFQRPTAFAGTVAENLRVAEPELSDRAVRAALVAVGLDPELTDRSADDLSGGEAQRMCLARSLVCRPEVLLMDEASSALDPRQRLGMEQLTVRLVEDGVAVAWVTHDMDQVRRIARHVVAMDEGRVVWEGPPEALDDVADPVVQRLVARLPDGPAGLEGTA